MHYLDNETHFYSKKNQCLVNEYAGFSKHFQFKDKIYLKKMKNTSFDNMYSSRQAET